MAEQLLKHCPEVTLTLNSEPTPDYELMLNRESWGIAQILLVRDSDKNVLYAAAKPSLLKAVKEGCKAIMADWKLQHSTSGTLWQNTKDLPPTK
jgi:hypothetical protein